MGRVLAFTLFIINDGEGVGFYFYREPLVFYLVFKYYENFKKC